MSSNQFGPELNLNLGFRFRFRQRPELNQKFSSGFSKICHWTELNWTFPSLISTYSTLKCCIRVPYYMYLECLTLTNSTFRSLGHYMRCGARSVVSDKNSVYIICKSQTDLLNGYYRWVGFWKLFENVSRVCPSATQHSSASYNV
jgi:hypothetical protein